VVSEALGAALVPVAYVISGVLVPELLAAADAPASLQADVAEGQTIAGLAMTADLTGLASAENLADAILVGTPGYRTVLARATGRAGSSASRSRLRISSAWIRPS
jgi:hypothetical protein